MYKDMGQARRVLKEAQNAAVITCSLFICAIILYLKTSGFQAFPQMTRGKPRGISV
jgi:hypothetical protein